jgi:predicted TIM-barrel fold metal-dependent hydrolase
MNVSAFEAAQAGGVIDLFLGLPDSKDKQAKKFDKIRAIANDAESKAMAMPAQYMFKGVPTYDEVDDPVALALTEMDKHNIRRALLGVHENVHAQRGFREHPDRFLGLFNVDPNQGMDSVRALEHAVKEIGVHAAHCWGTGLSPQVPIADKKMYPLFAKCVELDVPIVLYAGVPGPRIPMYPQTVDQLDEICWFFPELKVIVRHGAEPWTALMVKLLLKWPNLYYSTSAFAPKHYPPDIIDYANTRGADKIMYAGYYAAGLTLDRIFSELPSVPFRDEVWPKFLRDNAQRVFGLTS